LFVLVYVNAQQYNVPDNPRKTYNINSDWKLKIGDTPDAMNINFDDSSWKPISLPHAFNEDEALKYASKNLQIR
jgi:Glycosyl hydrolases family 2, sugar binding domain.